MYLHPQCCKRLPYHYAVHILPAIALSQSAFIWCRFINSLKAQHTPLKEARVLFFGAGSSAVGVAELIALLLHKDGGMSKEEAYRVSCQPHPALSPHSRADSGLQYTPCMRLHICPTLTRCQFAGAVKRAGQVCWHGTECACSCSQHIWMMDSKGIITKKRGDKLPPHKLIVARDDDTPPIEDLHEAIRHIKPHALIGLSGHGPAFDKVRHPALHFVLWPFIDVCWIVRPDTATLLPLIQRDTVPSCSVSHAASRQIWQSDRRNRSHGHAWR